MSNLYKLSEYTDMIEEQFQECIGRMDMKAFINNPKKAMEEAGITLKKGITFQLIETAEEANNLPSNVLPLIRTQKNNEHLSMESLDKVAGGKPGDPLYYAVGVYNKKRMLITENEKNKEGHYTDISLSPFKSRT